MNSINCMEIVHERSGAAVARWAHNPKVGGSKPPFAIFFRDKFFSIGDFEKIISPNQITF